MTTGPTPARRRPVPAADPTVDREGATLPAPTPPPPPADSVAPPAIGDTAAAAADPAAAAAARPDPAEASTADLLRGLTDDVRALVQGEIASARAEMTDKARAAGPAAAMLGGAALLGALAAGTSAVVLVRALDKVLPPTASALVATALLGGGAAALARTGIEDLRLVGPPVPERTVRSVKADVEAVTDAAAH